MPLGPTAPAPLVPIRRVPPANALQQAIAEVLDRRPCYVGFSGGCDSSLVLAAATAAARAMGLDDPVPVTFRYGTPQSDERTYQELVVRSLGLREWSIHELGDDADLLAPTTCALIRDEGPVWPPTPLTRVATMRTLEPGVWLTGEAGDAVLGPRRQTHATVGLRRWAQHPAHPPRRMLQHGALQLAPRPLRARRERSAIERDHRAGWLTPELRAQYVRRAAEMQAGDPLRAGRWAGHLLAQPTITVGHRNLRAVFAHCGLEWHAPLADPGFLGALAGSVPWHGYRGRPHLLRTYFSALVPPEIANRTTKASFNTALFGPHTKAFAERWDGTGAPDGVDGETLRTLWLSDAVPAGTASLLHHVWLATEGQAAGRPCR